jgi:prepilin-type processing-associated H-X9-DG protein
VYWRSWDQILVDTELRSSDAARDSGISHGNAPQWYKAFQCPSDDNPRTGTANGAADAGIPPRSYAVNQSRWAWGCSDSDPAVNNSGKYSMPWSPGIPPGGNHNIIASSLSVQKRLSQVPAWIWILGENWGTSSVYTIAGNGNNGINGVFVNTPTDNAVFGRVDNAFLDGSPARFHGGSAQWFSASNSGLNGGNYGYADGHVEFVKWNDCVGYRSDTSYLPGSATPTIYLDHWKWWTTR